MSVSFFPRSENPGQEPSKIRSRFETCLNLSDGHAGFPLTRIDPLFEEQPQSFSMTQNRPQRGPGDWLVEVIRRLSDAAQNQQLAVRPLHVPMPIAIFIDEHAAARAAQTARDCGYCPQEFMLEFQDASLASSDPAAFDRLDDFRREGFRIALDARKSYMTPFSARIRTAIERLRVSTPDLIFDETLQLRADIVACLGGDVIVDRATWRQSDELQRLGATHALKLMSDA